LYHGKCRRVLSNVRILKRMEARIAGKRGPYEGHSTFNIRKKKNSRRCGGRQTIAFSAGEGRSPDGERIYDLSREGKSTRLSFTNAREIEEGRQRGRRGQDFASNIINKGGNKKTSLKARKKRGNEGPSHYHIGRKKKAANFSWWRGRKKKRNAGGKRPLNLK